MGFPGEGPVRSTGTVEPMECDETMSNEEDERRLQLQLQVLSAVRGVSGVTQSEYTGPQLNRMGVQLKVEHDGILKKIYVHCSATLDTKLKAALN